MSLVKLNKYIKKKKRNNFYLIGKIKTYTHNTNMTIGPRTSKLEISPFCVA